MRPIEESERQELDAHLEFLDHVDDVLSFSSSIPPFLPSLFFAKRQEVSELIDETIEAGEIESRFVLEYIQQEIGSLKAMLARAKKDAATRQELAKSSFVRPPSRQSEMRPVTAGTKAMDAAQAFNAELDALNDYFRNLQALRLCKAKFYVVGFAANGQGDTAFIVRVVTLLRGIGLTAYAVKPEVSAHDASTSFQAVARFLSIAECKKRLKDGDFLIEGPLSDPIPDGLKRYAATHGDLFCKELGGLRLHNLRLYEYGTLVYRGGQAQREPSVINVVHFAADRRHAFMGMGAGEIGAFYNAGELREGVTLSTALSECAGHKTCAALSELLSARPNHTLFIGYANSSKESFAWAVRALEGFRARKEECHAIILAVFGGKYQKPSVLTPQGIDLFFGEDKGASFKTLQKVESPDASILFIDHLPATVMNAIQRLARPFTLATGNYSLSEAIENGHLAVYEMLHFNAGVQSAYEWQVQQALVGLEIGEPLGGAVRRIVAASPSSVKSEDIAEILGHPEQIAAIMMFVRSRTRIDAFLIARLAQLLS